MGKIGGMSRDDWALIIGHALLSGDMRGQLQAYKIANSLRGAIGQEPLTYTLVAKPKESKPEPQPQEEPQEPQDQTEEYVDTEQDEEAPEPPEPPQQQPRRGPGRPPTRNREPPKLVQKKQQQTRQPIEEI